MFKLSLAVLSGIALFAGAGQPARAAAKPADFTTAAPPLSVETFDVQGAGTTPDTGQGTLGLGINELGVIAGLMRDENSVRHGFLRYPDGKIVVFDHPNAGTAPGQGTRVGGLNALGAVAGSVRDSTGLDTPFVYEPDGTFHSISIPNFQGGNGDAINLWGTMTGNYLLSTDNNDPNVFLHYHGFIRSPSGVITQFDPPGSQETDIPSPSSINDLGAVTGDYWVCSADLSSCSVHGFIRDANGKYTTFDVPGANPDGYAGGGTYPQGINNLGEVTGYYGDANLIYHAFVRRANGGITSFDMPTKCTNTSTPPEDCAYEGTFPSSVNLLGQVVGTYYGEDGNSHGFLRDADGSMKKVDLPGAGNFSDIQSINDFGQMTGYVTDSNGVNHGLLASP
jgi:hypothetical protein